ncbi:MAG: hypothetical protein IPI01_17640 [Ignavibacteriae bacterium]|nr:hypothetical protein [Ignavibacteriota bacterium]
MVETAEALLGIRLAISVYPAVFFGIVIVCLLHYGITKQLNLRIQDDTERQLTAASHA